MDGSPNERFLKFRKKASEIIKKDKDMPVMKYKYIDYHNIVKFINDESEKYGFIRKITTEADPVNKCNILKSKLFDLKTSEVVYESSRFFYVSNEGRNANHTTGANETYAKRYADTMLLDISPDEDTDGLTNSGGKDGKHKNESKSIKNTGNNKPNFF